MKERHIKIQFVFLLLMCVCVFMLSTCNEPAIVDTGDPEEPPPGNPALQSIAVTKGPNTTTYTEGDVFSPAGMTVVAAYTQNAPSVELTYNTGEGTDYTFSPAGYLTLGDTVITISYGVKSTTVSITVKPIDDDYFSNDFDSSLCSFYDKFDGTSLDYSKWGHQNGNGNNGWGNNEKQYYKTENAVVADGILSLVAKKEEQDGFQYTSAKLVTANGRGNPELGEPAEGMGRKFAQTYGRFEAKIRLTVAEQGLWPAFWMMPADSFYGGWPRSGEVDIMEMKGRIKNETSSTIHCRGGGNQYRGSNQLYVDDETADITQWHVYGIIWTPSEFIMLIDGWEFNRVTKSWWRTSFYNTWEDSEHAPFDKDFYMILNFAIGGNFDGNRMPSDSVFPCALEIDWVRAYTLEDDPWEIFDVLPASRKRTY